jgi:hypothetical protein
VRDRSRETAGLRAGVSRSCHASTTDSSSHPTGVHTTGNAGSHAVRQTCRSRWLLEEPVNRGSGPTARDSRQASASASERGSVPAGPAFPAASGRSDTAASPTAAAP